ncbi:MAG: hypothetical protein KDD34_07480 [Bdellovibrionales bacterium]|nr:hypothetical protein [Bdellovibrionales bacterium]
MTDTQSKSRIRSIQNRDLQVVQQLIRDYPGFSQLSFEAQLDRIVLILESVCGFGAVGVESIEQLSSVFSFKNGAVIQTIFESSEYVHSETGDKRKKYRQSFEGGFCLERDFKKQLANEGGDSQAEGPIRKKVVGKVRPKTSSSPTPLRKPTATTPKKQRETPVQPSPLTTSSELSTKPVDNPTHMHSLEAEAAPNTTTTPQWPIKPFVIGAAVLVVIGISVIAFLIDR